MNIQKTKKKIIEEIEGKKIVPIKLKFSSRLDMFWLKWKIIRKFPDYSIWKEIKELFFPQELEVMIK